MKRPRVLHLIHHLRVGGAERLVIDLAPRLRDAGFDVQVACLDEAGLWFDALREHHIRGHLIGRNRGSCPSAVWRLARLLRLQRIDLLHTHSFSAGFWGRLAAIVARTPRVVVTHHAVEGWSQPRKQRVCNRLLRPVTDRVVAVSESVKQSLVAQGEPGDRVRVIHNGVNLERFRETLRPAEARARLGLNPKGPLIGMIGRCRAEKGGDDWVRSLALLRRFHADVRGVLVGDGPDRKAWEALAVSEGLAGQIRFAGAQVDSAPWLAALDVLVCPSLQESFGLAAVEAQAAGIPVVATRAEGFLEVLHDGEDALLAPRRNPAALAKAVRALLDSPALGRTLAAAGRRNASRFSIARTAEGYGSLYRDLLPAREKTA